MKEIGVFSPRAAACRVSQSDRVSVVAFEADAIQFHPVIDEAIAQLLGDLLLQRLQLGVDEFDHLAAFDVDQVIVMRFGSGLVARAAIAEIVGCFAFWAWLRLGKSVWWLIPGTLSLALFAYLLTLVDAEHAGRSYATYGGIYIVAAVIWLWAAEGVRPDRWDLAGVGLCLLGACVILLGPHRS